MAVHRVLRIVSGIAAMLVALPRLHADSALHPGTPELKHTLVEIVQTQLDAFNAGDFEKGRALASAALREKFDPPAFERLIRTTYPAVAHSKALLAYEARDDSRHATLVVRVTGANDAVVFLRYDFAHEDDAWKISGVTKIEEPGVSA